LCFSRSGTENKTTRILVGYVIKFRDLHLNGLQMFQVGTASSQV